MALCWKLRKSRKVNSIDATSTMNRRLFSIGFISLACPGLCAEYLSRQKTFVGEEIFRRIMTQAQNEEWGRLSVGERVARAGLAMKGTPYVGFTLEIDDLIESPSVNFLGLDCWTFFETALAIARLLERSSIHHTPSRLLQEIEWTRYRGGKCGGNYLDRIHYLEEWFRDNAQRRNVADITPTLAPVVPLTGRKIDEMTVLWKSYRYLRHNPELRTGMARMEEHLQKHPFHYIPKALVPGVEARLQSGDIIGIVTHKPHVYCSHVGLALRTQDGILRLMHASSTKKKVIIDQSLSGYLEDFKSHAGIIVARPL